MKNFLLRIQDHRVSIPCSRGGEGSTTCSKTVRQARKKKIQDKHTHTSTRCGPRCSGGVSKDGPA